MQSITLEENGGFQFFGAFHSPTRFHSHHNTCDVMRSFTQKSSYTILLWKEHWKCLRSRRGLSPDLCLSVWQFIMIDRPRPVTTWISCDQCRVFMPQLDSNSLGWPGCTSPASPPGRPAVWYPVCLLHYWSEGKAYWTLETKAVDVKNYENVC